MNSSAWRRKVEESDAANDTQLRIRIFRERASLSSGFFALTLNNHRNQRN